MAEILYPYAKDENGNLVYIRNVQKETRYEHKYTCPCCGNKMKPRLGKQNTEHFAHDSGKRCSKESYVHLLAKMIIEKRFNEGTLEVKMYRNYECQKQCRFFSADRCMGKAPFLYNLPRLYDTVVSEKEMEKDDEVFRPDVTISDSTGKLSPILIEVCNTSPCSTKKIENCGNIIEIKVKEFNDLINLRTDVIDETEDIPGKRRKGSVMCYNFDTLLLEAKGFPMAYGQIPFCLLSEEDRQDYPDYWRLNCYEDGSLKVEPISERELKSKGENAVESMTAKFKYGYEGDRGPWLRTYFYRMSQDYRDCSLCRKINYSRNCRYHDAIHCNSFANKEDCDSEAGTIEYFPKK